MIRSIVMTAATVATTALSAAAQQPITATDLLQLKQITEVDVAPNGAFAIYALQEIVDEGADKKGLEKYDYRTHLWMMPLDDENASPRQLTFGDRDDTSPEISPDGAHVAFVRQGAMQEGEAERPKPQVWVMPLGAAGEARQVTTLEHGATSPAWRPDSKALLVASAIPFSKIDGQPDWDHERPARDWNDATIPNEDNDADASPDGDRQSVRNWLERNAIKGDPNVYSRLAFQDELAIKGEDKFAHLFLIELSNESQPKQLTHGFRNHGNASFSPDGQTIVFVDKPRSADHPDRTYRASIYLMSASGGGARALLDDEGWSYNSPRFAPNDGSIIFTATQMDELLYRQSRLGRIAPSPREPQWLAPDWPSDMTSPVATAEGVYYTSPWQGGFALNFERYSADGHDHTDVVSGPVGVQTFDASGARIVAAITSIDNPSELVLIDRDTGDRRQLTKHNESWLQNRIISRPTEHWIDRPDGERIQYWVMEPTNRRDGEQYPVVLEIHGGPMAMWGPGEFSMWHEFQLLCSWGYGIVYSNPRGSGGYGYDFQRANHTNWGEGPTGDVLACLDEAIANNDWIDADRQFVTGGSYAGYLTAWIIAHTDRFDAAVAQRGVYDLHTFFGEGNAWLLVEHAMGGFPWDPEARIIHERESPFTYVDQITTPFLIMHGSNDLRTGVSQSEMMYRALKELDRPVEYVRYPNAGHDLSRNGNPRQRLDRLMRIVEFFERYANNQRPAPVRVSE